MVLILGESLLAIKLNLIMTSLLTTPTSFMLAERLQNPEQLPLVLGSLLFLLGYSPDPSLPGQKDLGSRLIPS